MMLRADRFFNLRSQMVEGEEAAARVALLQESRVFGCAPDNDLVVRATMFERRVYAPGDEICRAGEAAGEAYLISSGEALVYPPGEAVAVAVCRRGDVIGEYGLFIGNIRTATVLATEPTNLLSIDYFRLRQFLLSFPESMFALMQVTVQRMYSPTNVSGSAPDTGDKTIRLIR